MQLFIISIASPLLVGIYENNKLVKSFELEGKTSDVLPVFIEEVLKEYDLKEIFYVNSPGSYMAIKVTYIFLKTLSITKNIKLYASFGFNFNENSPIKALGKKYFINDNGNIKVDFLDKDSKIHSFKLPEKLDRNLFSEDNLPIYNLPAVN